MLLTNFFEKIKIFFIAIKLLENWYLYPLVYFKLIKQNHIIFKTKTGLKIRIRVNYTIKLYIVRIDLCAILVQECERMYIMHSTNRFCSGHVSN